MKLQIIKREIDVYGLITEINLYRSKNNEDPYLFMNRTTMKELVLIYKNWKDCKDCPDGVLNTWEGYRVYENDQLEDGEVEIR